ncbi:MAG: CPXCG motif-containing cysteine-rich protein [Myxococcales bacterium]|nr:CPXCG motif-containing cysteine-rich protein [Myxococcales bacterium]MDH3484382.1 CPXCG motif-containing cysteine-rich protein [Myxococcales bacterium]
MDDTFEVICPYCFEVVEIYVDPETQGELIEDCDVCCRPWALNVARTEDGELAIQAVRAQ